MQNLVFTLSLYWLVDRVYSGDCSSKQVYEEGTKEIALSVVSGINCKYNISIFISNHYNLQGIFFLQRYSV